MALPEESESAECQATVLDVIASHTHTHMHPHMHPHRHKHTDIHKLLLAVCKLSRLCICGGGLYMCMCVFISVCAKLPSVHWGTWSNCVADA